MSNVKTFVTHNNRFYEGMTLQEAKRLGRDKTWWRRDFNDIDTNKDGVLSAEEIFAERDKIANRYKTFGYLSLAETIFDALSRTGILSIFLDILLTCLIFNQSKKINQGTAEMKKIHSENMKTGEKLAVNA